MVRTTLKLILALIILLSVGWLGFSLARKDFPKETIRKEQLMAFFQDVLKLGVMEVKISQIFEVNRENLRVAHIPIPFTGQKSLIVATGTVLLGYDLDQVKMTVHPLKPRLEVRVSDPIPLSMDIDFRFLKEQDTFLNRISPEDRNQILINLKTQLQETLIPPKVKSQILERTQKILISFASLLRFEVQVYSPEVSS